MAVRVQDKHLSARVRNRCISERVMRKMKPTINWCAFCKHWRGGYTPKCQFCEMYDVTVPPDKFEAEHIGVSNRQAVQKCD